jgi:hypothetical protein
VSEIPTEEFVIKKPQKCVSFVCGLSINSEHVDFGSALRKKWPVEICVEQYGSQYDSKHWYNWFSHTV